ncbi:MAG: chorismate mutase [Clostridiales bacterium]|jgi:chorismate mutase/prephenate dehydratase|nr:chorismate mutase [Clostridiales bacterium]
MEIEKARRQIDLLDDQIAKLFGERMSLVREIGLEKAKGAVFAADAGREKEIVNRIAKAAAPDIRVYLKQVFGTLFDTSKAYQNRFIKLHSDVGDVLRALPAEKPAFPDSATVACQGTQGAFSALAAEKLFKLSEITYFRNFEGVFNAVQSGLCEYGVLPIENSSAGSVGRVYDLMKQYKFTIVKAARLQVRHNLMAKPGARLGEIREVVSHEQALAQCAEHLKKFGDVKLTACDNTAVAAKLVADSPRADVAAISSAECADLYGLQVLEPDIHDNAGNFTRFICISRKLQIFKGANKISIMVKLANESGALQHILSKFTVLGLNLTKLESRPLPNTNFEFLFYFDFEADASSGEVLNLLAELSAGAGQFVFLGNYLEN